MSQTELFLDPHAAAPKLNPEKFDAGWRAACNVEACSIAQVDSFLQKHYLKKRPGVCVLTLVMKRGIDRLGCIVYALPPPEVEVRYGGKTWELARLYLLDEIPRNAETWLIAQSVRYIKRHHPDVVCLVSYADPGAGHAGVIYKAANWAIDGDTESRGTPRSDYYDARTGIKYGRKANMPPSAVVERRPRLSKHRFYLKLK